MQLLVFIVPPTLACITTYLLQRKKHSPVFIIGQWVFSAFAIYVIQSLVMIPLDRSFPSIVSLKSTGSAYLYIHCGKTSLIAASIMGCIGGALPVFLQRRWQIKAFRTEKRTYKKCFFAAVPIHTILLLLLFLTFSFIWGVNNYGNISFNEIIFHLNMPLKGTSLSLIISYIIHAIIPTVIAFVFLELLIHAPISRAYLVQSQVRKNIGIQLLPLSLPTWSAWLSLLCWFSLLLLCANHYFCIDDYIDSQLHQSEIIESEYVNPKNINILFPEKKRNLITIYVESCETSSQDRDHGGFFDVNYIPEMTQLALDEISFSQSDLVEGAAVAPACGWTTSGLVAQSTGLPLKMYTYGKHPDGTDIDNIMERTTSFMPKATSLGDILKSEGYKNVFMAGSDFTFGGRRQFYEQHGNYEILDYLTAKERNIIPSDYHVFWGLEDEILYDWAKKELTSLASSEEPFHLAMLTVDTHMPYGYVCEICPDIYDQQIANVLACSSRQVMDFIQWCRKQPFYENTTIVVTGDHASMVNGFYNVESDKHIGTTNRLIYNVFINSAISTDHENNRMFTTLDFFPTTLAAIGVKIEGERLGLGTNLFSGKSTLSEIYGYETLFEDLNRKSLFYDNKILYP